MSNTPRDIHVMPIDEFHPHVDFVECWCEPELVYVDEISGNKVWLHKDIH